MTTFALIHGGSHEGWCWELLVPELEARGHSAVAPDLPFEDTSYGALAWARAVIDAIGDTNDEVIVVAHSVGGMAAPVVCSLYPVSQMVLLGAMVPAPGMRYIDYLATEPGAVTFNPDPLQDVSDNDTEPPWVTARAAFSHGDPGISWIAAREGFYQDCPEDVARMAWERLRPQTDTVFTEVCPVEVWPNVPTTVVVMNDDRAVAPDWSRRVARERLGAPVVELPGGHSPFLSRPAHLADVLVDLAAPAA